MIEVEIFSREECSLCDRAKAIMSRVAAEVPFVLRETLLRPESTRHREYLDHVPVIHVNGVFFARHRLDEEGFRKELMRHARNGIEPG
jgi:glutaredoxin